MKKIRNFVSFLNEAKKVKKSLTEEQIKKVKEYLQKGNNGKGSMYWDYNDEISDEHIDTIIEKGMIAFEEQLMELCVDSMFDIENNVIAEACKECGVDVEGIDPSDLRDEFLDFVSVDMDVKGLLKNKEANVRIEMTSNYDCINSHWFETQGGGYTYDDTYFGEVVNALNLNPSKVESVFKDGGVSVSGNWPNKKNRDGKEYVEYDKFLVEDQNRSCGACLLTFLGKIRLTDLIGKEKIKKIVVPKGNPCGYFSSMQGGGSPFELELKKPMEIDLEKTRGTKYDGFRMVHDAKSNGYTIRQTYGTDSSIFGGNLTII